MDVKMHVVLLFFIIAAGAFTGWFAMNWFINLIVGGRFFQRKVMGN